MQIVSCADVEIVKVPSTSDSIAAALVAEKNTSNTDGETPEADSDDHTLRLAECSKDAECGKGGQCLEGGCFCQLGYFGRNCLKGTINSCTDIKSNASESKSTIADIDLNAYKSYTFAGDRRVHWRVDDAEKELELVLRFPADSWLAFGIRSADAANQAKCLALGSSMHTGNKALGVPAVPTSQENSLDGFPEETLPTRGTVQIKKIATTPMTTVKTTTSKPTERTTVARRKVTTTTAIPTTVEQKGSTSSGVVTNATSEDNGTRAG